MGEGSAAQVRSFLSERFEVEPDRFEAVRSRIAPLIREVADVAVAGEGEQRLEVLRVAGNPHEPSMLAAWLPATGIMFAADLFYPEPMDRFPSANRLPIMKWFAGWLAEQKLSPRLIYPTHGETAGTAEHLERVRE